MYETFHVEAGLEAMFSGFTVTTVKRGDVLVPVYVDAPDPQTNTERAVPGMTLVPEGYDPDPRRMEGDQYEEYVVGQDDLDEPTQVTVEVKPKPWIHKFSLHTWADDPNADRLLVNRVNVLLSRRVVEIEDADGSPETLELMYVSTGRADYVDDDEKVFHKVIRFNVLTWMFDPDSRTTSNTVQTVSITNHALLGAHTHGQAVPAADAERSPHRTVSFNNGGFWLLNL